MTKTHLLRKQLWLRPGVFKDLTPTKSNPAGVFGCRDAQGSDSMTEAQQREGSPALLTLLRGALPAAWLTALLASGSLRMLTAL